VNSTVTGLIVCILVCQIFIPCGFAPAMTARLDSPNKGASIQHIEDDATRNMNSRGYEIAHGGNSIIGQNYLLADNTDPIDNEEINDPVDREYAEDPIDKNDDEKNDPIDKEDRDHRPINSAERGGSDQDDNGDN
jgi:hypothetical protein